MPPTPSHLSQDSDCESIDQETSVNRVAADLNTSIDSIQSHMHQASSLAEHGACSALFAHEVNNLMTQVGGRAQLALIHPDKPSLTIKALELAVHASNQISQLAQSMMTRDPSENSSPATDCASVSHIHDQTLAYLRQDDVAAYRFQIDDVEFAATTQAPAVALGQVLLNLYLNAIRAIEESGRQTTGIVAIRLMTIESMQHCSTGNNGDEPHPQLQIEVEDNGIGMNQDQIRSITCVRSGSVSSSQIGPINETHPRHGFGLKVSMELLEQVGGALDAQSIPGEGTRMTITLPYQDHNAETKAAA